MKRQRRGASTSQRQPKVTTSVPAGQRGASEKVSGDINIQARSGKMCTVPHASNGSSTVMLGNGMGCEDIGRVAPVPAAEEEEEEIIVGEEIEATRYNSDDMRGRVGWALGGPSPTAARRWSNPTAAASVSVGIRAGSRVGNRCMPEKDQAARVSSSDSQKQLSPAGTGATADSG
ncbi:unnamed protein product, partial [Choristocarpus tenellus]